MKYYFLTYSAVLLGIKTGALTRCIIVLVSESALWDTMAFESY